MFSGNNGYTKNRFHPMLKKSGMYLLSIVILFVSIGILTTLSPAYRFSSDTLARWTSEIDSSTFLYLLGMENRAFTESYPDDYSMPNISSTLLQVATSIKPQDPRSLLGNELPGFSIFDTKILIAGEGSDYTNMPVESSPPLEDVLEDRHAIIDEEDEDDKPEGEEPSQVTEEDVVFLYNTHNYESFLPHLPDVTDPDSAHHNEVNITKVSDRLAQSLQSYGIGTYVDKTDNMKLLDKKGWEYWQSYQSSRDIVQEAFAANKGIQYVFDIHRDALDRSITTKEINGEPYARIYFLVGTNYESNEKNLTLANQLHNLMEEKYPGLSRGVKPQGGAGNNGVYNQDLHENAILLEIGGVHNNLDELYRSADALAEVFSEFYWEQAEPVNAE
ncbi:stage II sporulation protein P [Ornithinibacillus sp. L9]|uniref:Stage II sporulation protein P n=1 Tax=Ornithinibacillus caprae TaxID=2678566 RepID=A0A6N8FBN1_9BACI|nr:stage II sporulation protein P [Ornithinibacillus caprae]MUK87072.1 stage II sporulation protein P [Ornithinibacillus caprae]